ncbi:MAG: 30S ribosomal protein S13 [Chloroflexi bacterium]|nr:30S ribosomal protein S13 [Chloroflexota bacterium]
MRLVGVDIPDNKKVPYSLRYIYGIGPTRAAQIVERAGVNPDIRVRDLSEPEVAQLREALDRSGFVIEGDLRRETQMNIRRLVEIGSYRGMRHRMGLPVRGQRSRTNARTRKGPKKTVAGRRRTATR